DGIHGAMDPDVAHEREGTEAGPDSDVASEEGATHPKHMLLFPTCGFEQPHERQTRGKHHRGDHRLPRDEEEEEGGPERRAVLDQAVVVEGVRLAAHLGGDRERPSDGDRDEDGCRRTSPRAMKRRSDRGHAVCSIFHSDWIAFLPVYSHVIPYCGR